MVHIPSSYAFDFWLETTTDPSVELSCLMPNGVFIPLEVNRNATLQEIKEVSGINLFLKQFLRVFNSILAGLILII